MKSLMRVLHAVLVLSLLSANPAAQAEPRQKSSSSKSFKGGFSSQRAGSPPPRSPRQESASRGGFGSFNSAPSRAPQRSDSAMSRQLDREASQDRALRTLDARRAQREQAERDTRPVPGYENAQSSAQRSSQYDDRRSAPAQRSDNGLGGVGGVVTGMVLGQMANNAAARNNNGYPGQVAGAGRGTSSASVNQAPSGGPSFFGGVMRMFMWLIVLSAIGWLVFFLVRRKRRTAEQNKPNYTFEGQ